MWREKEQNLEICWNLCFALVFSTQDLSDARERGEKEGRKRGERGEKEGRKRGERGEKERGEK
jgi:hypothetical protein